ncbi:cyclase family protein [Shinella sp. PSBB067]|uniref:cyclase family protein n=1 Tax=unclassified Shinella TaxID=2643062 RepID=UPI00193B72F5|nr:MULTISPECIES: cyclase family protein [unclassified Shinella]MBN9052890.1 cyclase family protein [Hyphomicrobiales bacterium]QRI63797.1 cyclase family protein [Shinella sp. PSBB067]
MTDTISEISRLFGQLRPVDLAPRLERGIPRWPTHPHLIIDKTMNHEHDGYFCQGIVMAEHTGAHVDAPAHNHPGAQTVDQIEVDKLFAPAVLYDFSSLGLEAGELITPDMVERYERENDIRVGSGEIALVNYGWMKRHWRCDCHAQWYATNAPGMTEETVILFKERGIRAIGTDTVACEIAIVDGKAGHSLGHDKHWLPNGILIMEMLARLEQLSLRSFFAAAPLPFAEGSGSPLRPIAFCER